MLTEFQEEPKLELGDKERFREGHPEPGPSFLHGEAARLPRIYCLLQKTAR